VIIGLTQLSALTEQKALANCALIHQTIDCSSDKRPSRARTVLQRWQELNRALGIESASPVLLGDTGWMR
jgi:hypothetical protein